MLKKRTEEQHIKKMADLLRQGSTLTNLVCPVCSSPLFRLKTGELWCAQCEKKAIVVKEGEELTVAANKMIMKTLEATLITKIQEIQNKMQHEKKLEELQKLSEVMSKLLENLKKTRETKKA
jgi:UPF0148 protein